MRTLDFFELELVAGATQSPQGGHVDFLVRNWSTTVTIGGVVYTNSGAYVFASYSPTGGSGSGNDPNTLGWDTGQSQEGSDEDYSYPPINDHCLIESNTDTIAELIQDEILDRPDWQSREYGAVIYTDSSGAWHSTPVFIGDNNQVTYDLSEIYSVDGVIRGYVHNHPDEGYSNSEDLRNRAPSMNDWAAFRDFLSDGAPPDLRMYIIDPWGHMRQFNSSDMSAFDKVSVPAPGPQHEVRAPRC